MFMSLCQFRLSLRYWLVGKGLYKRNAFFGGGNCLVLIWKGLVGGWDIGWLERAVQKKCLGL